MEYGMCAWGTAAKSNFWPENRFFDYIDKRRCSSMSFRDKNTFCGVPVWFRLVGIHKKKKF